MRIGHLDCFSGVSGDMWVGAVLDLGLPLEKLEAVVASLGLPGVRIGTEEVRRAGLRGTRFSVGVPARSPTRHLEDVLEILERADLPEPVRLQCREVFELLADAEAHVHGTTRDKVHFHEVGAEDTIVDVVCACLGTHLCGFERLYSSAVTTGTGTLRCEHGVLPVPAPGALASLLGVPLRGGGPEAECVTPTGAALLKVLVESFEPEITWTPGAVGYGAGSRDLPGHPNLLRLTRGEQSSDMPSTWLWEISCNLDTASGETLGYLIEAALERGAVDAFAVPIHMKKGRPGYKFTALASTSKRRDLARFLLQESSTLGVRMHQVERGLLERWEETRETSLGPVRYKVARLPSGELLARAEEDEVRRLAVERNLGRGEVQRRLTPGGGMPD